MLNEGAPLHGLVLVEWFSGVESPTRAFESYGFTALGFDIDKSKVFMDIINWTGFIQAVRLGRRIVPYKGLQHFATVCSTWVWMSRSSTRRRDHNILGDRTSRPVICANCMVTLCCLLKMGFGIWCGVGA